MSHRSRTRRSAAAGLILTLAGAAGCAPKRLDVAGVSGGPEVGVYRGRVASDDGRSQRFRLLLFAAPTDRLHAEVVTPLGETALIIDGTDARISVAIPRERRSYVGTPGPDVLERVAGVRIRVADLVAGLLEGDGDSPDWRISRRGGTRPGLPERFLLTGDGRSLELRLKRRSPLRAAAEELGTGEAPPGFEVRPLEELDRQWLAGGSRAVDTPGE